MTVVLLDTLRAAVGAANVLTDGDLSAYEVDWRQRYRGRALAVVRPGSTDEVAQIGGCGGRRVTGRLHVDGPRIEVDGLARD